VLFYVPSNTTERYAVVYLLPGHGLISERWIHFTEMAEASNKNIEPVSYVVLRLPTICDYVVVAGAVTEAILRIQLLSKLWHLRIMKGKSDRPLKGSSCSN
jgi:hypothetical protein